MRSIKLSITSKNYNSLHLFLNFFLNTFLKKIYFYKKLLNTTEKKKIISLLTSPHVYKNAQEQFQVKSYKSNFFLELASTSMMYKFILFFKKLKQKTFADIKFKIFFYHESTAHFFQEYLNEMTLSTLPRVFIKGKQKMKLLCKRQKLAIIGKSSF